MAALGLRCCVWAFSTCREWATLHCGAQASHCGGFSLLWSTGSRHLGFSSCGSWALEHRFSSCGARALLLPGMWDLPRPGLEPMSPALAGRFLATAPPGKHLNSSFTPLFLPYPTFYHPEILFAVNSKYI